MHAFYSCRGVLLGQVDGCDTPESINWPERAPVLKPSRYALPARSLRFATLKDGFAFGLVRALPRY